MLCPNCNHSIQDGHLMCEKCGYEIRIVPDYEPSLEHSIEESISAIQENYPEQHLENEKDIIFTEDNPFQEKVVTLFHRKVRLFTILCTSIVIIFAVLLIAYLQHVSLGHQMNKAMSLANKGKYEEAITCLSDNLSRYPKEGDIPLLIADYYRKLDKEDDAYNILLQIIEKDFYDESEINKAYAKLIDILEKQSEYQKINDLLLNCKYDSIVTSYQNYLAKPPEFSIEEGVYDEIMTLKISSNTAGKIYYTLDGTKPTENSQIYTSPIFLESGNYHIAAVFINTKGIVSEITDKKYSIDLIIPDAPVVDLPSGQYDEPIMVNVTADETCEIFYTTDNSTPTTDSVPYTGPIPLPLGTTNFKFVAINEKGAVSDITMRSFNLSLKDAIPQRQVVSLLVQNLVERNYLMDLSGHKENTIGLYSYHFSSVIRTADGRDFYTIYEYFDDGTGIPLKTDVVFLMEIHQGTIAKLGYDEAGNFIAYPF